MLCPPMLAMSTVSNLRMFAMPCSINASMPGFCSPTLFIMPDGVSYTRMPSLPSLGCKVSPLELMPPRQLTSYNSLNSSPNPNVPDAAMMGFLNDIPWMEVLRFIVLMFKMIWMDRVVP